MKFRFLFYSFAAILLLSSVVVQSADDVDQVTEDVNGALMDGECSHCSVVSTDGITCYDDNDCDKECYKDASNVAEIKACCSQCSDETEAAIECVGGCLPACVYDTVVQYSACVSIMQCETDCEEAINEAAEDIENEAVSIVGDAEDGDSSIDFDVTDLEETIEETQDLEDLGCSDLEGEYKESMCGLANCCPYCIDQFEDVAECIINEVVFELILNNEPDECDVECGDNPQPEVDVPIFDGWPVSGKKDDNGDRSRRRRSLQPSPGDNGPPGDGGPPVNDGPGNNVPGSGGDRASIPEAFGIFEECQMLMSAYMALGEAQGAYDAYMSCLMGSLTKFSNSPQTSSSQSKEGDGSGAYHNRNVCLMSIMLALSISIGTVLMLW